MKTILYLIVTLLIGALGGMLFVLPSAAEEVLTNATIVKMVKAQVGESTIIAKIKASATAFDLSVDDIITLKNSGVSDKVIEAMLNQQGGKPQSPTRRRPASSGGQVLDIDEVVKNLESLMGKKIREELPREEHIAWSVTHSAARSMPPAAAGGVDVVDAQKQYYTTVKGKQAAGEGIVFSLILGAGGSQKVTILAPASTPLKGYNVVLITNQDARMELHKGDRVFFEGKIGNLSNWHGVSLDIEGKYEKVTE